MKFLRLVIANLLRKKTRVVLTVGSFAVALFLFGLLVTVDRAFYSGTEVAGADRLVTRNKTSLIMPLPFAYTERIAQLDGVADVTFATWFGAYYQDQRNQFANFAIEHESYRRMYPEFVIPEGEWQAFIADREGCVVGRALAKRFGWKVGDRIPLQGTIWPGTWALNIRAIYDGQRPEDDTTQLWFRWDYLDERRPFGEGTVGWFVVRVADPDRAEQVIELIDERFTNSPVETTTQTERVFVAGFIKQFGNIRLLIVTIGSVVFFTLLLVSGNTMAMAVRERTGELAVLKAVGFSDRLVLFLVLAEPVALAAAGAAIGLALAKAITPVLAGVLTILPSFHLPTMGIVAGFGLALLSGVAAGLFPGLGAKRLAIVDALRRV